MNFFWYVPVIFSIILLVAILLFQKKLYIKFFGKKNSYRSTYLNIINRLSKLNLKLQEIEKLVHFVQDIKLIEYYEGCLRLFENLLTLIKEINPVSGELHILNSAEILITDCEEKAKRTEKGFKDASKGKPHEKIFNRPLKRVPIGCYFCSKPFIFGGFSKVKVILDGEAKQVYSCDQCKHILKNHGSVKVLFFIRDGKTVHWSDIEEYNPLKDYKTLYERNDTIKKTDIRLIYTKHDSKEE